MDAHRTANWEGEPRGGNMAATGSRSEHKREPHDRRTTTEDKAWGAFAQGHLWSMVFSCLWSATLATCFALQETLF